MVILVSLPMERKTHPSTNMVTRSNSGVTLATTCKGPPFARVRITVFGLAPNLHAIVSNMFYYVLGFLLRDLCLVNTMLAPMGPLLVQDSFKEVLLTGSGGKVWML